MANGNNANIGFEKQIWDAACVLWGHIPAAEYRKVIVGLIFLRYISSAFEKRYQELVAEGDGFEDDRDAYVEDNIFFVPEDARWSKIASSAHTPEIGTVIDDAMRAIEKENTTLKNVLPKNYASPDLDKRVLGDVVDLFTNMDMGDTEESKDLLGRTYEYCIQQFAAYEGVKGGEFYTPASIVKTIVAILKPFKNCRVYDPCCGSGTLLIESALAAAGIAPGIQRRFAAMRWEQIPETLWKEERERARSFAHPESPFHGYGSDIDADAVRLTNENAIKACVGKRITAEVADLKHFVPRGDSGVVLCNPPYGERLLDVQAAEALYRLMGKVFVPQKGWSYAVISPHEDFERLFGRKADRRRKLYNGMLKCQLYMYFG